MNIRLRSLYTDLDKRMELLANERTLVETSRQRVEHALKDGKAYYGINTGFGALASTRIDDNLLGKLQENLIRSHSVGVGPFIPKSITRLMLGLKAHSLALGYSGISTPTFDRLVAFYRNDLIPMVPSQGSVGASGDLAPLAHMSLPLIGMGAFWDANGKNAVPVHEQLQKHGLEPIQLGAKDGLSLINGTQMMLAYAAYILEKALQLMLSADILAAMSLEALQGSIRPFDARIHDLRPHPGQIKVAENVRNLLAQSEILESHRDCGKVQDPYCLRCVPQVHGASRDAINYAANVVEIELNSVTDNPIVFDDDIISGGNFHGQPLALALDFVAIALAELASISERRTYLLLEGHDGLPKLLMKETGINSGFMIPQYTAASLVSENKVLCHPASVDTIPTSLGQEDHVSMGSIAAVKLLRVLRNTEYVLAIELLTACQALDFREPLKPGVGVSLCHEFVRSMINHAEEDYLVSEDLANCTEFIRGHALPLLLIASGFEID
jgi:histidine ammonia-lyase